MSVSLKGKRLLLLGGAPDMIDITKLAQSMGCIVYVTDYYDTIKSPAKLVADYSADISITDYDTIVEYIKENKIDGVMTGYTCSYLEHYLTICEKAGLPHYGSKKSFELATDKMMFKNACREFGVSVIPGCNAYDYETVEKFAEENGYPLILKPVDNSGSRGVIKCEGPESLKECFEYSLSFSRSKNVIVERFMDCESFATMYQLKGHKAKLSAVCEREPYQGAKDGSAMTVEARYPAKYIDRYVNEVDAQMVDFLEQNDFTDGMVSTMGFVDDKGFYLCEVSYRPSGGHHYTLIDDQVGVNGLALLIEFAVTGDTESYDLSRENPYFKEYCGMIHLTGQSGRKISSVSGVDEIKEMNGILDVCQELQKGQVVGKEGTTAQTVLSVWLKAANKDKYDEKIDEIKSKLVITYES